ncbi:MAG: hypothetical protein R3348_00935, partial [Xanthomonadales bacterium]|nr:hypothetical protein [Xanthomonadales bacterium]
MRTIPWLCVVLFSLGCVTPSAFAQVIQGPNGHYYERVDATLTWEQAHDQAAARSFGGEPGQLAVIFDAQTNSFLLSTFRAS